MLCPIALTIIGLTVIAAGIYWQRREEVRGAWLRSFLPCAIREMLEHRYGAYRGDAERAL